jgi:hypothetical protein
MPKGNRIKWEKTQINYWQLIHSTIFSYCFFSSAFLGWKKGRKTQINYTEIIKPYRYNVVVQNILEISI